MKNLIRGISLFSLVLFASCEPFDKELVEKKGFDLLSQNTEIPNECKPPMASEENKRAFVRLRGRINRCAFFIPQYPELNRFSEVNECLNSVGEYLDLVPDQVCKDQVIIPGAQGNIVDVMNTLVQNFYIGNVRVIEGNETTFKWENVKDYFSLWASWFNQTRNSVYKLSSEKVISSAHSNEFENKLLKVFWDDVQTYTTEWRSTFGDIVKEIEPTNPDGTIRTPEEIAVLRLDKNNKFEIFKTMLNVNQRVIDLAFESKLGVKETVWDETIGTSHASPLLAALIGDSIQPFFERIQVITKIYDIACKLQNCTTEFYETNKTFWMVNYLNSLSLNSNVEVLDLDRSDVLDNFLMTLVDRKEEIQDLIQAVNSTFALESISRSITGSDYPEFLESFGDIFNQSFDLVQNYENTRTTDQFGVERAGFFSSGNISEVNVGFSKANIDRHIKNVQNANSRLVTLRDSFARQKHTLIQEVLALNAAQISLEQLEDRINIDLTDLFNFNNQVDSVRNFISESQDSFSNQVKNIIENQRVGSEEFFTHPEKTFVVEANQTSIGNPDVIDGATLEEIDQADEFKKGDLLRVSVTGEWSPTCAVSSRYGDSVVSAKTSGSGFTMIESNGQSRVQSVDNYKSRESFSSNSTSVTACVGTSTGSALPGPTASLNICTNSTWGTRTASGSRSSTTTSSTKRSDASFNIGVTLPNTPYPYLTAGSLLLVTMPKGENFKEAYKNIYILNGNDNFVVPEDNLDFYLIGNDCSAGTNTGSLTVKVLRQSAIGAQALNFVDKISQVSDSVESRVNTLIANGQLSHQLLQSIRSELLGSVGQDINGFTGPIRQLLDAYISNEIAVLDYKSQLTNMERQLEAKKKNLLSLIDQYSGDTEQRFLRVHTRNWLVSNLDLDFVNQSDENQNLYTLNRILNTLENSLVSFLDFKYRNDERDLILGDLSLLSSIDISDNFDTISERVTTYVSTLLDNLEDDINNKPVVPQTTVGIRIPNPFYEPTFENPFPDNSLHPKMDEARAANLWGKIRDFERFDEEKVDFEIRIEDLYLENGLACYTEIPIIETMGLFFVPENEGYVTDFNNNYRHQNSKLFIDGLSQVPFESVLRSYNFVELSWRYMDVATRMAISPNDAMNRLVTEFPPRIDFESGLGTGRPVFGKFKVGDLKGLRRVNGEIFIGYTPLKEIKELFIAYVVSASNSNFDVNLNWIEYCKKQ